MDWRRLWAVFSLIWGPLSDLATDHFGHAAPSPQNLKAFSLGRASFGSPLPPFHCKFATPTPTPSLWPCTRLAGGHLFPPLEARSIYIYLYISVYHEAENTCAACRVVCVCYARSVRWTAFSVGSPSLCSLPERMDARTLRPSESAATGKRAQHTLSAA